MKTLMSVIRGMDTITEEVAVDLEESTAEYAKSLEKIANDKKLKAISKSDKATLSKLADMMKNANEEFIEEAVSNLDEMLDDIIAEDYFTVQYYDAKGKAEEGKSKDFGDEKSATKHLDKANKVVKDGEYKMFKVKGSMDEAFESIEEAMDNWTITVDKAVNKLKKGDEQKVKARSAFEAINKAMKLWGDPSLKAAPFNAFKVTKEGLEEARLDPSEYTVGAEKSKKGYRAQITHNAKGYTMYFSGDTFKDEKDAKAQAQAYLDGYVRGGDGAASKDAGKFAKKNTAKLAEEVIAENTGYSSNQYNLSDSLIAAVNSVVTGEAPAVEHELDIQNDTIEAGDDTVIVEAKMPEGKVRDALNALAAEFKKRNPSDGKDMKAVVTQILNGNEKKAQALKRGLDTDLRDALQDVLEPNGMWEKGAIKLEALDKADPKAAKKKFDDRADKDIDNDGDVDDSDEYLHNKRKAISKAASKEENMDNFKGKEAKPFKKDKVKKESKDGTDDDKEMKKEKDGKKAEKVIINPKLDESKFKAKYGDRYEAVMVAASAKLAK